MADKKTNYIKCPRCELNYIPDTEELCDVCKAELNLLPDYTFLDEFEDEEILCPICHINYISGDEEMCSECRLAKSESMNESEEDDDSWREFLDEDTELDPESEEEEVLLSQLQDEEFDDDDEEEEDDEYINDEDADDLDNFDNIDLDEDDDDEDDDEEEGEEDK